MRDLESRLFYATCFEIKGDEECIFISVLSQIWKWLKEKANVNKYDNSKHWNFAQFRRYGDFCSLDRQIIFSTTSFPKESSAISFCWGIRILEKQITKTAPRDWVTEIVYEHIGNGLARISLVCAYKDFNAYIGLLDEMPTSTTPRIVRGLLNHTKFDAFSGNIRLTTYPQELKVGEAPDFFEKVIRNTSRRCPVIVIGATPHTDNQIPIINPPGDLLHCVLGNAIVYYIKDTMVHEEIYHTITHTEYCPIGSVKVYLPIDQINDNLKMHFLSYSEIRELGSEQIQSILRRSMSQHIAAEKSKILLRYEDCIERFRHDRFCRMVEKLDNSALTKEEWEKWCNDYENMEQKCNDLYSQLIESAIQNEELEYENQKLANSIKIARDAQQSAFKEKKMMEESLSSQRYKCEYPDSIINVVNYFKTRFSDQIVFTDRCFRSINDCVSKSEIVWNCLNDIVFILYDLYKNDVANIEGEFNSKSTFEFATGEGSATRGNSDLMRRREDYYKEHMIILEPHIKKRGSGIDSDPQQIRVYFDYIRELNIIAIGHIGGHLQNATSAKVS